MIEITSDVQNPLLLRREVTCTFKGLAGKLKKLQAAEMISNHLHLEGKVVIPVLMKAQGGKPDVTCTFYIYDNEELAKKQVNPTIFKRLEKAKAKEVPPQKTEDENKQEVTA